MRTRLSVLLVVLSVSALVRAQGAPPQGAPAATPTFRAGASYVRVDLYATRDNQPVDDLTPGEIEVLEDGVPQTIEAFEHVQVRTGVPQEARIEPATVEQSRQMASDARARVFVVFLDTYHTSIEGSSTMRVPLVRFLDRVLGPDDLVAVMTPEMSATDITFGRKTTVVSNIMQAQWDWARRNRVADNDPKENLYESCYGGVVGQGPAAEMKARRREKLTLDAIDDLVVHLGGVREERKAVLMVSEGWVLFREKAIEADAARAAPPNLLPGRGRPRQAGEDTGRLSGGMMAECEADRQALSAVNHEDRIRRVTEEANRGNVTFYPVFARGLIATDVDASSQRGPGPADTANLRTRQDSLRTLADGTDGVSVINTNNIDGALKRITDDLSQYYLLGYYSTNTRLDGRFRSVSVRVSRPGVRVRARRGYRGRTAADVLNATTRGSTAGDSTVNAAMGAVAGVDARSPFRIRASSWARTMPDGAEQGTFWVVGELDFRTRRELAWTAGARAEVVVVAADGREVETQTVDVPAAEGAFALRVPQSGALPLGDYAVRVRVVPEADAELSLTDLTRVELSAATAAAGQAVMWRRGRSTGPVYLRTADPRFQRSDRLRLELPTAPGSETASARLLDRAGNPLNVPVQVSERQEPAADVRWIVVDASLAPFAPGDYAIEVTYADAKLVTGFRVVP